MQYSRVTHGRCLWYEYKRKQKEVDIEAYIVMELWLEKVKIVLFK